MNYRAAYNHLYELALYPIPDEFAAAERLLSAGTLASMLNGPTPLGLLGPWLQRHGATVPVKMLVERVKQLATQPKSVPVAWITTQKLYAIASEIGLDPERFVELADNLPLPGEEAELDWWVDFLEIPPYRLVDGFPSEAGRQKAREAAEDEL